MRYDFDSVIDRIHAPGSYSFKWAETGFPGAQLKLMAGGTLYPDRICAWNADMDFRCAPAILEALHETVDHGIFGYSFAPPAYYEAVAGWFARRFDWHFSPDHVFVGPHGTHELIGICEETYTKPGDGVIVLLPSYGYHGDIEPHGRKFVGVPMIDTDGYFTIDWDAFETACAEPNNTMFVAMQPHNPTGRVFTVDEIRRIGEICRRHNVLIFSDEVHIDIARKGQQVEPMMKVLGPQGIVTATAVNKTFNVAGLSMSNLIIEDDSLREQYARANGTAGSANPFGISAVIAAYTKCDEWVDQLNEYLDKTLTYTVERFHKELPQVKVAMPEGTYILWMDFSGLGLSDEELAQRFNASHVLAGDGAGLDATSHPKQWRRICLTCPMSQTEELCDRIIKALQ